MRQIPDELIIWRSKGPKGYVDGAVTFHELAPNLTRVLLVLEYHPQGLFEHTGNLWRAQGRRARLELKHFRRHAMTQIALHPDEVEGWRGVIEDGKVVKDHETALQEEQQEREEGLPEGEAEEGQPDDEAALEFESAATRRVGWSFLALYTLAFTSTNLLFLAPLLVTLALKVNALVGISQAPQSLALVASVGALLSMVGNPFFGKMSDRTSSQLGMRRPWMVIGWVGGSFGILIVALIVFGPSKLPQIGAGLGKSIRDFKKAMAEASDVASDELPCR